MSPAPSVNGRIRRVRLALGQAIGLCSLESLAGPAPEGGLDRLEAAPELPIAEVQSHVHETVGELHRIVDEYLEGEPELHGLVEQIAARGSRALNLLGRGEDETLAEDPDTLGGLEAIIRTDGSRPSFLVREGEADKASSPLGKWGDLLDVDDKLLRCAIACVGRIDNPAASQHFSGTGFLVQEDLILTNRHVLQAVGDLGANGEWTLRPDVAIDFGHEYKGIASRHRRALRRVIFAGSKTIQEPIDHGKLDLALIELEQATEATRPETVLAIDASPDWPESGPTVYIVGYPGSPSPWAYPPTLLEQLFQQTFGYKRLAPGIAMKSARSQQAWTVAHDSTTLGGNSGSAVMVAGRPTLAAALHYGGVNSEPAENWGHILGAVLESKQYPGGTTLGEVLKSQGVSLVSRTISPPR